MDDIWKIDISTFVVAMNIFGKPKEFLGKPAPPNYVAGLGRGAVGVRLYLSIVFINLYLSLTHSLLLSLRAPNSTTNESTAPPQFTTQSDIGPAREPTKEELEDLKRKAEAKGITQNERFEDAQNEEGLFGTGPYDEEDEEADRIYSSIDERMDERRRERREAREKEIAEKNRELKPRVQEQFAELKRGLATVSEEEWMNIPEPGDLRAVGKKRKTKDRERFFAAPDSLLLAAKAQSQMVTQLDAQTGLSTPAPTNGADAPLADFRQISKARDDLLKVKLDQAGSDSASGKTTVDPKGYLTDLSSVMLKTDAEIGDIKKARELLKSVITTNPKHGPGWIALARLEEIDNKMGKARSIIAQGCEECPKSEDVWLEAARLNTSENSKIILANGVRQCPQSVKIWLQAMKLEQDVNSRKRVVRKALEFIPNSVQLWKAAVELETDMDDARILLSRAVECVPLSVELWLALSRLETYDNAKIVLNRARRSCPSSHEIYIAAARLEESAGNDKMVDTVVSRAVTVLSSKGTNLSREQWIREAEQCEQNGSIGTCHAIIRATIGMDVDEEDREVTWMEDAEHSVSRGAIETARAIFGHALKEFGDDETIWISAAELEKEHGTRESLEELLQRAVQFCPQAEVLWLMGAKEKWLAGDVDGARAVLMEAFKANPNSEKIWLAAVKLETENGEYQRGRVLLQKARDQASTERVWLKSIVLERNLENMEECKRLLDQAVERYPKFAKFWMIYGQMEEASGLVQEARDVYSKGVKQCPESISLWLLASRLEEKAGNLTRARAILDKGRLHNSKCPELWLESVRIEVRAENLPQARTVLAKALQDCPNAGVLWADAIFLEPRPSRKSRSVDALKKCENNALVVTAVARLFWSERNLDKARSWFQRAVKFDADLGDAWATYFKFELQHGSAEQRADVMQRCIAAEPHHGEYWTSVSKSPVNWRASIKEILEKTAELIPAQ